MVWMKHGDHVIPKEESNLNFLTFVLQLRKNFDREWNPGPLRGNVTITLKFFFISDGHIDDNF